MQSKQTTIPGICLSFLLMCGSIFAQSQVYLSDLTPVCAQQEWGTLGINRSVTSPKLTLNGRVYPKGLGTHAYSKLVYNLDGLDYQIFSAVIGIDDDAQGNGSVVFHVWLDSLLVLNSGVMLGSDSSLHFQIPLTGAGQLILEVTDAGDGICCDHANWADAKLVKGSSIQGIDFIPQPQQKICNTKTTSHYLMDFVFVNWDSPMHHATIELNTKNVKPFSIPIGEIPYGWTRLRNLKIPKIFVGDTTKFVLTVARRYCCSKKVFIPPPTWIRAEGQFVALELQLKNFNVLNKPFNWLAKLDSAYLAYEELVGERPYGGKMITILEVLQYPGGWAVAGNPIKWFSPYIAPALQQVNQGDWLFGILHELGHDFDLDYKWVWEAELFANFKMVYVAEQVKAKVFQRKRWYDYTKLDGETLDDYYRWQAEQTDEVNSVTDWLYHNDPATHKFLLLKNMIGWEPFKQTFRTYQALPNWQVPSIPQGKLNLFVHYLEKYSGQQLMERFRKWGFPVARIPSGIEISQSRRTPQQFELERTYSNPFNPIVTVCYRLPVRGLVHLKIIDILGETALVLVNSVQKAGEYKVKFGSFQLANGIYFCSLRVINNATGREFSQIHKMVLLK